VVSANQAPTFACVTTAGCDALGDNTIRCESAYDCTGGDVCCKNSLDFGTMCKTGCGSTPQLCHCSSECTVGQPCVPCPTYLDGGGPKSFCGSCP
jgi:hypothetical protein